MSLTNEIANDLLLYIFNKYGKDYGGIVFALDEDIIQKLGLQYIVPHVSNLVGIVCEINFAYLESYRTQRYLKMEILTVPTTIRLNLAESYANLFISGVDITEYINNLVEMLKAGVNIYWEFERMIENQKLNKLI